MLESTLHGAACESTSPALPCPLWYLDVFDILLTAAQDRAGNSGIAMCS